ncbi:hypothetical protein U8V72_22345 [Priestia filamentosa]|uniref:hypothetical protein n=1 Tax=Priestia filamentosa TaxID=1402861 RepID=UPI0005893EFF
MVNYHSYIKSDIYRALKRVECLDIVRMKITNKILSDCREINYKHKLGQRIFVQEIDEGRGREIYIKIEWLDWQFKDNGVCTHSGRLMISKKLLDDLKRLGEDKD